MNTFEIIEEVPLNMAQVKDELASIKKRDKELNFRATKTEEYLQQVVETKKADELLKRMKGWFTADVHKALEVFNDFGRLKVIDEKELVIETQDETKMEDLAIKLKEIFHEDVWVEIIKRKKLA